MLSHQRAVSILCMLLLMTFIACTEAAPSYVYPTDSATRTVFDGVTFDELKISADVTDSDFIIRNSHVGVVRVDQSITFLRSSFIVENSSVSISFDSGNAVYFDGGSEFIVRNTVLNPISTANGVVALLLLGLNSRSAVDNDGNSIIVRIHNCTHTVRNDTDFTSMTHETGAVVSITADVLFIDFHFTGNNITSTFGVVSILRLNLQKHPTGGNIINVSSNRLHVEGSNLQRTRSSSVPGGMWNGYKGEPVTVLISGPGTNHYGFRVRNFLIADNIVFIGDYEEPKVVSRDKRREFRLFHVTRGFRDVESIRFLRNAVEYVGFFKSGNGHFQTFTAHTLHLDMMTDNISLIEVADNNATINGIDGVRHFYTWMSAGHGKPITGIGDILVQRNRFVTTAFGDLRVYFFRSNGVDGLRSLRFLDNYCNATQSKYNNVFFDASDSCEATVYSDDKDAEDGAMNANFSFIEYSRNFVLIDAVNEGVKSFMIYSFIRNLTSVKMNNNTLTGYSKLNATGGGTASTSSSMLVINYRIREIGSVEAIGNAIFTSVEKGYDATAITVATTASGRSDNFFESVEIHSNNLTVFKATALPEDRSVTGIFVSAFYTMFSLGSVRLSNNRINVTTLKWCPPSGCNCHGISVSSTPELPTDSVGNITILNSTCFLQSADNIVANTQFTIVAPLGDLDMVTDVMRTGKISVPPGSMRRLGSLLISDTETFVSGTPLTATILAFSLSGTLESAGNFTVRNSAMHSLVVSRNSIMHFRCANGYFFQDASTPLLVPIVCGDGGKMSLDSITVDSSSLLGHNAIEISGLEVAARGSITLTNVTVIGHVKHVMYRYRGLLIPQGDPKPISCLFVVGNDAKVIPATATARLALTVRDSRLDIEDSCNEVASPSSSPGALRPSGLPLDTLIVSGSRFTFRCTPSTEKMRVAVLQLGRLARVFNMSNSTVSILAAAAEDSATTTAQRFTQGLRVELLSLASASPSDSTPRLAADVVNVRVERDEELPLSTSSIGDAIAATTAAPSSSSSFPIPSSSLWMRCVWWNGAPLFRSTPQVRAAQRVFASVDVAPTCGDFAASRSVSLSPSDGTWTHNSTETQSAEETQTQSVDPMPQEPGMDALTAKRISDTGLVSTLVANVVANNPSALLGMLRGQSQMRLALCAVRGMRRNLPKVVNANTSKEVLTADLPWPELLLPSLRVGTRVGASYRAALITDLCVLALFLIVCLYLGTLNKEKWKRHLLDEFDKKNNNNQQQQAAATAIAPEVPQPFWMFCPFDRCFLKPILLMLPFVCGVAGTLIAGQPDGAADVVLGVAPLVLVAIVALLSARALFRLTSEVIVAPVQVTEKLLELSLSGNSRTASSPRAAARATISSSGGGRRRHVADLITNNDGNDFAGEEEELTEKDRELLSMLNPKQRQQHRQQRQQQSNSRSNLTSPSRGRTGSNSALVDYLLPNEQLRAAVTARSLSERRQREQEFQRQERRRQHRGRGNDDNFRFENAAATGSSSNSISSEVEERPLWYCEPSALYFPKGSHSSAVFAFAHRFLQTRLSRLFLVGDITWINPYLDLSHNVILPGPGLRTGFGLIFNAYRGPTRITEAPPQPQGRTNSATRSNSSSGRHHSHFELATSRNSNKRNNGSNSSSSSNSNGGRHHRHKSATGSSNNNRYDRSLRLRMCPVFVFLNMISGVVMASLAGTAEVDPSSCKDNFFVAFVFSIIIYPLVIWLRPYIVPWRNAAIICMETSNFIGACCFAFVVLSGDPPSEMNGVIVVAQVLSTLPAAVIGPSMAALGIARSALVTLSRTKVVTQTALRRRLRDEMAMVSEMFKERKQSDKDRGDEGKIGDDNDNNGDKKEPKTTAKDSGGGGTSWFMSMF